MNCRGDDVSPI